MTPKDKIIEFLCHGVPTLQIAEAVGCDPSYVSQIKALPEVAERIAASVTAATVEDIQHDDRMDRVEQLALERIERTIQFANFGQALAAFKVLNTAERRNRPSASSQPNITNNLTVNLTLPSVALPNYVKNSKNEIIEVEGKTMLTATPRSLDAVLAARAAENTPKHLPQITDVEKAANILENLPIAKPRKQPRTLPAGLSADLL